MVETTEEATMNMIQLKYVPSKGTASEVAGIVSATMFKNTVKLSNIVTPKDNFSPESGGSVNPSTALEAIKTPGTIKVKK
jgi:hypothetical protein